MAMPLLNMIFMILGR